MCPLSPRKNPSSLDLFCMSAQIGGLALCECGVCVMLCVTNPIISSPVACCAWSPTGSQLASAGDKDKLVVLWD